MAESSLLRGLPLAVLTVSLVTVPVLVREEAMRGTGYFPLGREQSYAMSNEDPPKYLVGTAEVSLTAYHTGETLELKDLPKKTVAMSPCFRREAGTYGKDTAGLYTYREWHDPPGGHSFGLLDTPQGQESWTETLAFLAKYLTPDAPSANRALRGARP
jgi:hypothetical protein